MSTNTASPFYNPAHDQSLTKAIWPMVCRCRAHGKNPDVVLDTTRNMWVCKECRKPWIVNENYVVRCEWCGNLFVIWIYSHDISPDSCKECGGNNVALPNHVTEDYADAYEKKLHGELA